MQIRRRARGLLPALLPLVWLLCAEPSAAWTYVSFTSPAYSQTNYVSPATILFQGFAADYVQERGEYGTFTNVAVWADAELLGTADVQPGSNQTAWSFLWTNPPPPQAWLKLTATAYAESGATATSTIGIAINSTNARPRVSDASTRTVEATPVFISPYIQHSDAGQTCTLAVLTQPTDGSVTIEEGEGGGIDGRNGAGKQPSVGNRQLLVYTPVPGFTGTNRFTFRVNDGFEDSNIATATVTVATNTPPIARNTTNTVLSGASTNLVIFPSYTDPDGGVQTMNFLIVSPPVHGAAVVTNAGYGPAIILYTTPDGYLGRDVFTYRVNDGLVDSNVATGEVNMVTNTAPVALPARGSTAPTTTVSLAVGFLDRDEGSGLAQSFSLQATSQPGHGTISTSGLSFDYTPEPGFESGVDSFRFVVSDGMDLSAEAECRVKVRPGRDRAGNVVLVVVTSNLYVNLSNEVSRLTEDLSREGYTAHLRIWPSAGTSVSNVWACLKKEYDDESQWMVGCLLIGNVPKARVTLSGSSYYTDQVYWNMRAFRTDAMPDRHDIWVSRIIAESATYGNEATLIRRALDANHDYRTGASRLPFTAFYYINPEWWPSYASDVDQLLGVWPAAEYRGATNTALRFAPERTDLAGYAGADAFVRGGELFDETSHGNSDGYMSAAGWFTQADLFRVIAQQRVVLATSCTSGAYGGIVNQSILTRGGGCILAVGGSDINYVGDFTIVGYQSSDCLAALARGESWGEALLAGYPFGGRERTLMFGDLSLGAMASGASNAMPHIRSCAWEEKAGRSVRFSVDVTDADGAISNIEWFCEGYDCGRRAPSGSGPQTSFAYTYPAPGTYSVRAEVMDDGKARDWREFTVTVQGPPERPMVMLSADNRISNLYVNGDAMSVGPNAADWTRSDTCFADTVSCLALKVLNDQPASNSAGVIAKVIFPDGHAEVSDGTWKAFDGSAGPPADDAGGRPWYATDYDDSAWPAAAVAGAFGVAPWGRPAGLGMFGGASWIWAGDPQQGVSPVYLRRRFVSWESLDSDKDGMSDAAESIAGTDPTNASSRLMLSADEPAGDGAGRLRFGVVSGRSYSVWCRADLLTGGWEVLPDYSNVWVSGPGSVSLCTSNMGSGMYFRLGVCR